MASFETKNIIMQESDTESPKVYLRADNGQILTMLDMSSPENLQSQLANFGMSGSLNDQLRQVYGQTTGDYDPTYRQTLQNFTYNPTSGNFTDDQVKTWLQQNISNPEAVRQGIIDNNIGADRIAKILGNTASDVQSYFTNAGLQPILDTTADFVNPNANNGYNQITVADPYAPAGQPKSYITSDFSAGTNKPSIQEFMNATGADFNTAASIINGVIGSNQDVRDWSAIMSAPDPLIAARQATGQMYSGNEYQTNISGDTSGSNAAATSAGRTATYAPAQYMGNYYYGNRQQPSTPSTSSSHPAIERLGNADWDRLEQQIVASRTAPLKQYESEARSAADEDLARRGIWSSGIAARNQNDITDSLSKYYTQAGADAATQRYGAQQADINAFNQLNLGYYNTDVQNATANKQIDTSYDLGLRNNALGYYTANNQYDLGLRGAATNQYQAETGRQQTANNYALGQGQLDLGYLTQNDNYAIQQAQAANTAAAQQAQAAWQAQWDPATYLAGLWNGTGGVISSGTGSNFSI